jgi:hypothetical protein
MLRTISAILTVILYILFIIALQYDEMIAIILQVLTFIFLVYTIHGNEKPRGN